VLGTQHGRLKKKKKKKIKRKKSGKNLSDVKSSKGEKKSKKKYSCRRDERITSSNDARGEKRGGGNLKGKFSSESILSVPIGKNVVLLSLLEKGTIRDLLMGG